MGKLLRFSIFLFLFTPAFAVHSDTYLLDTPTAESMPARTFGITSRIFSGGGVLTYFDFGVLNRLSIGTAITLEHLIGTNDEHVKVLVPSLQLKYRVYDGGEILPAVALGFDNQGFKYNHQEEEYEEKGKGIYMALTKEVFFTGFNLNGGLNYTVNGFKFDKFAGFAGASLAVVEWISLLFEWDNIRTFDESRMSAAARFYLTDNFSADIAVRNFNNKAERIAQIKYICSI